MLTEAIHTPFMSDRFLAIENAKYIFNNMRDIGNEVEFKTNGLIQKRAKEVLMNAIILLNKIEMEGLMNAIEKGIFANIKRPIVGGKGLDGVVEKSDKYLNPFIDLMKNKSLSL